jgi:hypothetical protein
MNRIEIDNGENMKKITFCVISAVRHGRRCLNALAEVFAPQKLLRAISAGMLILCAACGTTTPAAKSTDAENTAFHEAIEKSFAKMDERLANGSRVAVLPLKAENEELGNYAYTTLTLLFNETMKYNTITRAEIDSVIQEQNFQMTGMVSDETAVSIGKLLGAQVIVIGEISGTGSLRRVVYRCLEVETGKILSISQERF